jgi:hypothetical protein
MNDFITLLHNTCKGLNWLIPNGVPVQPTSLLFLEVMFCSWHSSKKPHQLMRQLIWTWLATKKKKYEWNIENNGLSWSMEETNFWICPKYYVLEITFWAYLCLVMYMSYLRFCDDFLSTCCNAMHNDAAQCHSAQCCMMPGLPDGIFSNQKSPFG